MDLQGPLSQLKGIGPSIQEKLRRLHIETLLDLLFHLPHRYEDRTRITPIAQADVGQAVQIQGVIKSAGVTRMRRPELHCIIEDAAGDLVTIRLMHFFRNQLRQLRPGILLRCFGDLRRGYRGWEMIHPQYRVLASANTSLPERLEAVYPTTEGLSQQRLRTWIHQLIQALTRKSVAVEDLLPDRLRKQWPALVDALQYIHEPPTDADVAALVQFAHPTQQRLALEELLAYVCTLRKIRSSTRQRAAFALPKSPQTSLVIPFRESLPFQLTGAQLRVSKELIRDISHPVPAMRLVQGDVGAGKTVVAAMAMLRAVENGFQAAVIAPTELLAEQHHRSFSNWFTPLGVSVTLLSGKMKAQDRRLADEAVRRDTDIIVGTHALFQESTTFRALALIVIDEQHRFGVEQRLALRNKGQFDDRLPHQILMTATPIPRTLAMTTYADLDVSIIDELPPGRTPVNTVALSQTRRQEVIERVRLAAEQGRQSYWVCTLVEDSEHIDAQSASQLHAELAQAFQGHSVALVHGRQSGMEKQAVMRAFRDGEHAVLVATTVIEVGVDVPNASLMIIENAERLGLSQLHQLRGRVGRGAVESNCVLLFKPPLGETAKARLDTMRKTNDGFVIAQKDLELRGPGEFLGTRQTGLPRFRFANLARDKTLLASLQQEADRIVADQPDLAGALIQRWTQIDQQFAET